MKYAYEIDTDIDAKALEEQLLNFWAEHNFGDQKQISITSVLGDDNWHGSIGQTAHLEYPERYYGKVNKSLKNTPIGDVVERYPDYYRWRIMRVRARNCYSLHSDGGWRGVGPYPEIINVRMHIPIITNQEAVLMFHHGEAEAGQPFTATYEHLEAGKSYKVNTTGIHTALNFHYSEDRWHIVGVKYESSDNWPQ